MHRSVVITAGNEFGLMKFRAASPSPASTTSWPAGSSSNLSMNRVSASSSTTRIVLNPDHAKHSEQGSRLEGCAELHNSVSKWGG